MAFRPRLAPVQSIDGLGRDRSRRCRWLSRRVAARDALLHPVHAALVTVAHGRLGSADGSHRLLGSYGLLARTVRMSRLPGDRPGVALRADVAAPEAAVAPGTLGVAWHLPRVVHAPEPRTGAPVAGVAAPCLWW
ncbi:MAG: hypothetical protein F4Y41_09820 [Gammaproteobacteria bacterium]|nr:hypothetical protein [Gammaproteobacteria bacterium]MYF28701.1 hypothetical protein [Gammaproteobacteria bacterium]